METTKKIIQKPTPQWLKKDIALALPTWLIERLHKEYPGEISPLVTELILQHTKWPLPTPMFIETEIEVKKRERLPGSVRERRTKLQAKRAETEFHKARIAKLKNEKLPNNDK